MKRPKEAYKKTRRLWKGEEDERECNGKMKARTVNDRVFFNLRQRRTFKGDPFAGYYADIKEASGKKSGIWV